MEQIQCICVVGAGSMGSQIALQAAVCGFQVNCTDISFKVLEKARIFCTEWLDKQVEKGRMADSETKCCQIPAALQP